MNTGNSTVDRVLARVTSKWRGSLFLKRTCLIGSAFCAGLLVLAGAIFWGCPLEPSLATTLIVLLAVLAVVAWFGIIVMSVEADPDRRKLAAAVEHGQPKLLDRVNTLVALEKSRREPALAAFYRRIAAQAQKILLKEPPEVMAPSVGAETQLLAFLLLLVLTIFVYFVFSPWRCMVEARNARLAAAQSSTSVPRQETTLELAAPTNAVKERLPWGEVRITDPGRDLQVTKVDVVPLQVEAAANSALQNVDWVSAINGQSAQPHPLPPPPEPRFAVYQPVVYLDEMKLSDWDVVSYYARASAAPSNAYASDVYFLEVRPFREEILKMPGGEEGQAMQCINELSSLISQQQHVIRQTHQHVQKPPDTEKAVEQDRRKLAEAEADLSQGARHLYARLASQMENRPIGDALDGLAKAEKELQSASECLKTNQLTGAQNQERGALADLVAARKAFQKAVSDHPDNFKDSSGEDGSSLAGSQDKMKQMAEFRDEAKAAQDFMNKLVERQRRVSDRASASQASRNLYPSFAQEEKEIKSQLDQFEQEHPQVFKPVGPEKEAAKQSLEKAEQALAKRERAGDQMAQDATRQLRQLSRAMEEKSVDRQLADAYKLKEMLDRQIDKYGQCQNPGASGAPTANELKQTAAQTRETLKGLKSVADQAPTRDMFGPELGESLSQSKMTPMRQLLEELDQAQTPGAQKQPAGQLKESLQNVSKAFDQSQPKAMQLAERAAKEKGKDGDFERGMAQLDGLVRQLQSGRPLSRQNQQKLGREALQNLQGGLPEKGGSNERGNQLLAQLEKELNKAESPVDVVLLKSVLEALQAVSVELSAQKDAKQLRTEVSGIDASRLPPAYRGRIEKYFQKLSEK